ncbi:MAG: hypothetical protein ACRDTD_13420 [Pseudonocardiaceae bacterium]
MRAVIGQHAGAATESLGQFEFEVALSMGRELDTTDISGFR